jgi:hypothetical protein
VRFKGKRVLELGTASGFLCFTMEQNGAEVVAHDLSPDYSWDIVPFTMLDHKQKIIERKNHMQRINNAYWFTHGILKSKAKVVYSTIYEIPQEIGVVDIATFGSILLHVRDPFLALQKVLPMVRETVVITDVVARSHRITRFLKKKVIEKNLFSRFLKPQMEFLPDHRRCEPYDSWWFITPELVARFIGVLGFENITLHYHKQLFMGRQVMLYTITGQRTKNATVYQE